MNDEQVFEDEGDVDVTEERPESTHESTQRARGRTHARESGGMSTSDQVAARQATALDLRGQGRTLEEVARLCGYASRSAARKAIAAARRAILEDVAEERRATFAASYGPVRQALHAKARRGDVRAAEALVRLDERECRLFGLDLTPEAAVQASSYTKRIILELEPSAPSNNGNGTADPMGPMTELHLRQ